MPRNFVTFVRNCIRISILTFRDEEGEIILIVVVVLVFVVAGLFSLIYFCCKVMSSGQQTQDQTTGKVRP